MSLTSQKLTCQFSTKCLSARIKQMVHRSKEVAGFLKRRSIAEEELGRAIQRAAQGLQEGFSRVGDLGEYSLSFKTIHSSSDRCRSFVTAFVDCSNLQQAEADCSLLFARACTEIAEEVGRPCSALLT